MGNEEVVNTKADKKKKIPTLQDFIQVRDYVGAITLIEVSICIANVNTYPVSTILQTQLWPANKCTAGASKTNHFFM